MITFVDETSRIAYAHLYNFFLFFHLATSSTINNFALRWWLLLLMTMMMAPAKLYVHPSETIPTWDGNRMAHGSTGDCRGYRARYFNSWSPQHARFRCGGWGSCAVPTFIQPWLVACEPTVVRPRLSLVDPPSWCQVFDPRCLHSDASRLETVDSSGQSWYRVHF